MAKSRSSSLSEPGPGNYTNSSDALVGNTTSSRASSKSSGAVSRQWIVNLRLTIVKGL